MLINCKLYHTYIDNFQFYDIIITQQNDWWDSGVATIGRLTALTTSFCFTCKEELKMRKKTHEEYVEQVAKINPNIEVLETYLGYDNKIKHKCKIDGHIWDAFPNNILRGKGCPMCKSRKISRNQAKTHDEYILELNKRRNNVIVIGTYINNKTKILHRCTICDHEWMATPDKILSHSLCPVCAHKVIGAPPEYRNSIWADVNLRRALLKYIDEDTMKMYTPSSHKHIDIKCPNCGTIKDIAIGKLCNGKFRCICDDGVSFPNKFVFAVMSQIHKDVVTEFSPSWAKPKKYDIYLESFNIIIENHGVQHYEETPGWKTTLREQQENDAFKEALARNNGITNYIVLDCRHSTYEWIKNSVMTSMLPQLLNFNEMDIDWGYVYEYANKNLIKEIANLYQEGVSAKEFAKMLNMKHTTVCKYLNIAHVLGWCNYDKHLIRCKGQQKRRNVERVIAI